MPSYVLSFGIPVNRPDLGGTVPILEHLSRCPALSSLCHDFRRSVTVATEDLCIPGNLIDKAIHVGKENWRSALESSTLTEC